MEMQNRKLISIIMPVYNSSCFVIESIKSVIQQSYKKWELIIVDDNSSDNSVNLIEGFIKKDERIKLYRNKVNNGAAYCRSLAISKAKGDFIAFLDSDDVWIKDKLLKQLDFMEKNEYKFTYSNYGFINSTNHIKNKFNKAPSKITYKKMLRMNRIGCLTVMVDSKLAKSNFINDNIYKRNDYALWLKYLKHVNGFCLDEVLAYYRYDSGTISKNSKITLLKYHYKLFRNSEDFSKAKSALYSIINIIYYLFLKIKQIKRLPNKGF